MYNGSLAHRKVWPASRACAESNCMDISLNKVRAGVFLVRDRPDTRLVVFLRNKPNKVLRVRQPGCVHEFCQRLGLRSALRASLFHYVGANIFLPCPEKEDKMSESSLRIQIA